MKREKSQGFTLTELLIAIAVVGILAAIALPKYQQGEAARASEAVSQLSAISMSEKTYKTSSGEFLECLNSEQPGCWNTMAMDDPEASDQRYFDYEAAADNTSTPPVFCAAATRRNENPSGNPNRGKTICLDNDNNYYGTHPNSPVPEAAPSTSICCSFCADTCAT